MEGLAQSIYDDAEWTFAPPVIAPILASVALAVAVLVPIVAQAQG